MIKTALKPLLLLEVSGIAENVLEDLADRDPGQVTCSVRCVFYIILVKSGIESPLGERAIKPPARVFRIDMVILQHLVERALLRRHAGGGNGLVRRVVVALQIFE